jgi:electron transfer flavoprotein beta subunit
MKILVPIKRVPDPYAKLRPLSDGSAVDSSGTKFEINPFDEIAMEEAVRIRERMGGADITVVSIGGAECEEQLRKALAMGADRAILVETSETFDSPSVAKELQALIQEIGPDLVLMGKQATDDDNNQAAQILAARLGWPQATFASKIDISGKTITVIRETDQGDETLEMELPAVITTDLRLNEPRYIALPGIIKARSKPLEKRQTLTTPNPKTRNLSYQSPAPRAAGKKVANVDELVSALKDRGVL